MNAGRKGHHGMIRRDVLAGLGSVGVGVLGAGGLGVGALGVGAWGSGALGIEALAANGASHAVAGQVAAIRGAATATSRVQSRTLSRALQLQDKVFVQDLLATSRQSRLNVKLGAATQLYMGENTRVVIDDQLVKRGGDIRLSSGALLFQREAPDPKPGVTINSPFALLAVRGTTVFAGPSNGVFGVFVVDGEVQVRAAGASVVLKPGEGTNIQRVGARPTAAAAWGKARIEAALASVR